MDKFNIKEYMPKNPKESSFIEYAYIKFDIPLGSDEFKSGFFSCFTIDDFIESMERYIEKDGITAKITGQNYITFIGDFYKMLSTYGITNDVFTNVSSKAQLNARAKEVFSQLKNPESKDIASDELYEQLKNGLDDYFKDLVIYDIYNEIDSLKSGKFKNTKQYLRFASAIAIKLIMQYGLSNITTVSLDISAIDIENKKITVNGFILELTDELITILKEYIKIREYILNLYSVQESKLLVKHDGRPYIKNKDNRANSPEYGALFYIMKDIVTTRSAEPFASRVALELLNKGIDISTVSKLTGKSIEKCTELQEKNQDKEESYKKLLSALSGSKEIDKKLTKKNFLKCPFCGAETKAVSDEWVLVQLEENGVKYIACGVCKGANRRAVL